MDEAEILSDKIVIMNQGSIMSQGSLSDIKNHFKAEQKLLVSLQYAGTETEKLVEKVMDLVEGVKFISRVGTQLRFRLPRNVGKDKMAALFDYLEGIGSTHFAIKNFALESSTLEEIFDRHVQPSIRSVS